MMRPHAAFGSGQLRSSCLILGMLVGFIVAGSVCTPTVTAQDSTVPKLGYYAAFVDYNEGEYRDALKRFEDELRGGIKTPVSRWIDSICYYTMIGECYYRMGRLDDALRNYTAALELYLAFPDWMVRVQFPPAIGPGRVSVYPWGKSARRATVGYLPKSMLIGQGQINQEETVRQGGIIQQAMLFPIRTQEIVRTTTLAIRRRAELLGPLSKHDPMTAELITVLSRGGVGLPNHWSQAWVDIQLGLALIAGGKDTQALPILNRAIVAAGQFDHPMTCIALLELGKQALLRGDHALAAEYFHESSLSAAYYGDVGVLEEAFRYGTINHLASNAKGPFSVLEPAAAWARKEDLRWLRVSLLLSAAENLCVLGQANDAGAMLDEARSLIGRRTMAAGRIAARLSYLTSMVLFQQRNVAAGNEALAAAMDYMTHGSHWLFHISQVDRRMAAGQINTRGPITPRSAMELYGELLRDPIATDWTLRPMESLAVLTTPHPLSMENWFLIAYLERKDHEAALEIADMARRHRFYNSLAFGGRLQSLRWILEAPTEVLSQQAQLNRQDLLAEYPAYERLSAEARVIRENLAAGPLVHEDPELFRQQQQTFEQFAAISTHQEAILREIAVRREPAEMVFPPVRSTNEVQKALPEGHVLLAFFAAGGDLYAFLLNSDNYRHWRVKATPILTKRIAGLLRSMGHFEQNRELTLKELTESDWKQPASEVLEHILDGSGADFSASFPELVIVPDGLMWYVPFESLLVDVGGQIRPLISRFRIRYAPTVSLAVPDGRGRNPAAKTAVVLGRVYPQDEDSVAQTAFEALARVVPRTVSLSKPPLPAPSAFYVSLMDQLVVLDDITLENHGPYSWAPVQIERNKPGNTLGDWLGLPWNAPEVLVLPGYHTAAENSLKRVSTAAPGLEVFLSVCGLMSGGTRTILLSRWRSGGQTSFDVVREFTQELPHTTPSDAWQRSALLVADSRLDLDAEPRIKRTTVADPPKAGHPFFWSGYMLIDSGSKPEVEEEPEPEEAVIKFREPGEAPPNKPARPEQPEAEE